MAIALLLRAGSAARSAFAVAESGNQAYAVGSVSIAAASASSLAIGVGTVTDST